MMEVVSNVVGASVLSFCHIYSWHCLENQKIKFGNYKFYVSMIIYVILIVASVAFIDKFLKIAGVTIISMLVNYFLMRKDIKRTILMPIITQIIVMISETLLALVLTAFRANLNSIAGNPFGGFAMDTAVFILVILIFLLCEFLPKIYEFVIKRIDKINSVYFVGLSFIVILIANVLAMTVYYKLDYTYLLIFNSSVTIVYFIIIINSFYNRNNYLKVYDKYNTTISSLKEYEDILNQYRVSNHENKNQLLTIRSMVKNKEKNIPEYIDKIVENKLKDNELLMGQSMIIPEGGLRGLIYSKMLLMKEKNIDFDLSVDKAIKTFQLINLGDNTVLDICKIIGVFLDNAIEAVSGLEDKFIDLEMSIESEKLYISVSNNYEGIILLEEIENQGYTTKGSGHGYGLSLVKKLVEENSLLKNEKGVSSEEFTQRLIVDVSKLK